METVDARHFYASNIEIARLQSELTALKLAATEQATQAEAVLNLRTWEFERKEKELCRTIHDLTRERDDAQTEVEHLRSWKKEMLAVESAWDEQAVGRALDMKWGTSIRPQILPKVNALKSERDALALSQGRLLGALKKIVEQISPCERMRGTSNYVCRWCYAFAGDPKQFHHFADCAYNAARAAIAEATPEGDTR